MKPAFDLKSLRLDSLVLRLNSHDWSEVMAQLKDKYSQYQKFKQLPLILDISNLQQRHIAGLRELINQLHQYQFRVVALRHDHQNWQPEAANLNLLFFNNKKHTEHQSIEENNETNAFRLPETLQTEHKQPQAKIDIQSDTITISQIKLPENNSTTENYAQQAVSISETARRTVVVNTPVRTGQQIYAENADLIVLGMVSEGAEVIADGNIHVYAPMRGRALAGEKGDTTARIFIQSMQAELVSIAGIYRVFEQDLPPHLHKQAIQVELIEDRLSIAPINAK